MSTFSVGGLASGLDTKTIISQLISIEGRPKQMMEWKSQLHAARKQSWMDLNSRLNTLKTSANNLLAPATWTVPTSTGTGTFTATSSNSGVANASVAGTPAAGTYAVSVLQLAKGEISQSTGALGAPTSGTRSTATWHKALGATVTGGENITALRTSTGTTMGLNTNSTITMNYEVNGVAQSASFKVNSLANGGDGTRLSDLSAWAAATIGPGASASWNGGQLEVTTAPGTANELTGLSFTAKNAAGTTLANFNSSAGASTSATTTPATNGGVQAGGDTLTVTNGTSSWNVALSAGDQMQDVVNKINGTSGIGVIATLVGSDIRLQSTTIGAASGFNVTSTGSTAAMLGFNETQSATDAQYTVNGTAFSDTSNNNLTTAIPGLSLNLGAIGDTSITIAEQTASGLSPQDDWIASTKNKIKDFVAKYNATLDQVYQKTQIETRVSNPKNLGEYMQGPMARNFEYSRVGSDLRAALSDDVAGLAAGDSYLASIGISTSFDVGAKSTNGRLLIDDAALDAALRADPARVQAVLTQTGAGAGVTADDGFARRISELTKNLDDRLDLKDADLGTQARRLQKSIDAAGDRLATRQKYYERLYANLETSLGKLQSQGSWLSGQLAGLMGSNR